jgi:two-component sensor histidine kinase
MRRIKPIIFHPFILSLIILGAFILLTPNMQKYRTELVNNKEISTSEKKLYYHINKKGEIAEIDKKLNIRLHTKNLEGIVFSEYFELDLDEDGETEYIFLGKKNQSMIITRNDLSHPTRLSLPFKDDIQQINIKYTNKIFPQLAIDYGENQLYFNYIKNKLYDYRHLFFLLVYVVIVTVLLIVRRYRNLYKQRKLKCEKEIAELKLKNIRNQLDPHFTLNVLNSIGYSFQSNDPETADYIFGKYSKLLRNTIFASSSSYSNLANELDYIQDYLDIEKFRMEDRFQYNIKSIPASADKIIFPKMMMHTFVENSIKHGIKPLKRPGYLSIDFKEEQQKLIISIQDNGIGRKQAEGKSMNNTGRGLVIIEEMIELFFEIVKIKISYDIIDLNDEEGNPKGTLIKITYPLK